jgi:hypothetical protein
MYEAAEFSIGVRLSINQDGEGSDVPGSVMALSFPGPRKARFSTHASSLSHWPVIFAGSMGPLFLDEEWYSNSIVVRYHKSIILPQFQ